jgi:hypothetical protein
MTHAPEGLFLQQLFERFNESGIRYAVMRNHEPLPFSAGGSDLDIIVSQQYSDATFSSRKSCSIKATQRY